MLCRAQLPAERLPSTLPPRAITAPTFGETLPGSLLDFRARSTARSISCLALALLGNPSGGILLGICTPLGTMWKCRKAGPRALRYITSAYKLPHTALAPSREAHAYHSKNHRADDADSQNGLIKLPLNLRCKSKIMRTGAAYFLILRGRSQGSLWEFWPRAMSLGHPIKV